MECGLIRHAHLPVEIPPFASQMEEFLCQNSFTCQCVMPMIRTESP